MTEQQTEEPVRPKLSRIGVIIAFLPIVTFLALAGIFWKQLTAGGNPATLPSALIGRRPRRSTSMRSTAPTARR